MDCSASSPGKRRLVAFLGHYPGLWLVYREPFPRGLGSANVIAAAATVGGMVAVAGSWRAVLVAWAIGHALWGAYLAARLPVTRARTS